MIKMSLVLLFSSFFFANFAQAEIEPGIQVFDTQTHSETAPGLPGLIYYKVYSRYSPKIRPIKACVLLHGHGFNTPIINRITGIEAQFPIARKFLPSFFDAFRDAYFGRGFVERLGSEVCETTYVLLRETERTSIYEMTLQTENFLAQLCDVDPRSLKKDQSACALLGHSKAGAVATSIVRRCMEAEEGESELGEKACGNLAKVYSAAGVNLGSGMAALLLGAKVSGRALPPLIGDIFGFGAFFVLKGMDQHLKMNLTGDDQPGSNPTWLDLGPYARMDRDQTLYKLHHTFYPAHKGWWKGEYSASAGEKIYGGDQVELIGSGTHQAPALELPPILEVEVPAYLDLQSAAYTAFSAAVGSIHLNSFRITYEAGVNEFENMGPDLGPQHAYRWEIFQNSDGVVEVLSALAPCLNGQRAKSPAVGSCKLLPNIHHLALAGVAKEAEEDIIAAFLPKKAGR